MLHFLFLAIAILMPAASSNADEATFLPKPTGVSFSWEKKQRYSDPRGADNCKTCYLKLAVTPVNGATQYDWQVDYVNGSISKTTNSVNLPPFYAESGAITVKVRARNGGESSDWFVKSWQVAVPADCCIE